MVHLMFTMLKLEASVVSSSSMWMNTRCHMVTKTRNGGVMSPKHRSQDRNRIRTTNQSPTTKFEMEPWMVWESMEAQESSLLR